MSLIPKEMMPLDPRTHPVYTTPMDATQTPLPHYLSPAPRKTEPRTFRIYQDQCEYLDQNAHNMGSAVVRLLLDAYCGKIPYEVALAEIAAIKKSRVA